MSPTECMISLVLDYSQIVFVGDHQQLGPVIMHNKSCACWAHAIPL